MCVLSCECRQRTHEEKARCSYGWSVGFLGFLMAYSTWTMLDGIYRFAADFATYEYQLIVGILQLTVSVINMNAAMMVIFYINDLKHNQKSHPERQPSPSAPRQTGEYTAVPVNE